MFLTRAIAVVIVSGVALSSALFSGAARAQGTIPQENIDRAMARHNETYVNFVGSKVVDATWLDASELAFATIDEKGRKTFKRYNAATDKTVESSQADWPESKNDWPGGFDVGGAMGPAVPTSPNGAFGIKRDGPNLLLVDMKTGESRALTTDGRDDYVYAEGMLLAWSGQLGVQLMDLDVPPSVLWSPDNRHVLTFVSDVRGVRKKVFVAPSAEQGGAQDYRVFETVQAMAGDEVMAEARFVLIDTQTGKIKRLELPTPYFLSADPLRSGYAFWSETGDDVFVSFGDLAERNYYVNRVNVASGDVSTIYREKGYFRGHWSALPPAPVGDGEIAIVSDQDGYRHLYLLDAKGKGALKKVSQGKIYIAGVYGVNDGWVYFAASNISGETDPYLYQLYRARLDGSAQQSLSRKGVFASATPSPDFSYFLLEQQWLDAPNAHVVINNEGDVLTTLAAPSLRPGEPVIERVSGLTRDERHPIWASLHKPTDFDPNKKYPVIHHVHGTVGFYWGSTGLSGRSDFRQKLADLGFIVMATDGMGGVGRTRDFLEAAYDAGHQCGGTQDAIALLKQLAAERPYIDLGRVGVYGFSQGGNCASRAIFEFPNDIHVSVSGAGNHDSRFNHPNEIYGYVGGGPDEYPERYKAQDNASLAHQLKGKVLFIQGGLDDDVPMVTTFHVINALIEHNKSYDLVMLPNYRHDAWSPDYYQKTVWDYFAKHLIGADLQLFSN